MGKNIDLWGDPWVGDEEGRFIKSEVVEGLNVVGDLIDENQKEWQVDVIERYFTERDQRCILAISLSSKFISDELTWAYSKDGLYSVKTAYMLGKGGNLDDFHNVWRMVWSLDVSPKVRHFLWRACTKSLPVKELLKGRDLLDDSRCPCCEAAEESLQHALVASYWMDMNYQELVRDLPG